MKNIHSPFISSVENQEKAQRAGVCYHVFINYRGPDVKHTLVSHINELLHCHGVRTFLDRKEIETGEEFSEVIREAIESASVHIAIFSKNYAQSTWCLRELSLMLKTSAHIIPVFYDVEPREVRWAKGTFRRAFQKHEKRFKPEIIEEWREALHKVSLICGYSLSNFKGKLARRVVDEVLKIVNHGSLDVPSFAVGLEDRVALLRQHILRFRKDVENVTAVGIIGFGGIGKSTLAKALYNEIRLKFRTTTFIDCVKQRVEKRGLVEIQRMLILNLLQHNYEVPSIGRGKDYLRKMLIGSHVLIVLDNVEDYTQMDALLDEDVLSSSSTIIVTFSEVKQEEG